MSQVLSAKSTEISKGGEWFRLETRKIYSKYFCSQMYTNYADCQNSPTVLGEYKTFFFHIFITDVDVVCFLELRPVTACTTLPSTAGILFKGKYWIIYFLTRKLKAVTTLYWPICTSILASSTKVEWIENDLNWFHSHAWSLASFLLYLLWKYCWHCWFEQYAGYASHMNIIMA